MFTQKDMKSNKLDRNGFTLIELMMVIAMVGVLASTGIPAFKDFSGRQQIKADAQRLFNSLSFARTQALTLSTGATRLQPVILVRTHNGPDPFELEDENGGDSVTQEIPSGYTAVYIESTGRILNLIEDQVKEESTTIITNDGDGLIGFTRQGRLLRNPGGTTVTTGTHAVLICRNKKSKYNESRLNAEAIRVEVSPSGRVSQKLNSNQTGVTNLKCPVFL